MEDELGIVYLIETAQQFWSELEDILHILSDVTLQRLDSAMKRFLAITSTYHEQYLQSPLQLDHACDLLLNSELFKFHSERMCEILCDEVLSNTDPHMHYVIFSILLHYGRRTGPFFRSQKRWQPLLPLLLDHILVEIDPDVVDTYAGMNMTALGAALNTSGPGTSFSYAPGSGVVPVPIELKLRTLAVRLVYEVSRVQKMTMQELKIFDDDFLDYLFDLVEQTRDIRDETFNYAVIKLIVALNEQFMVASLMPTTSSSPVPNQQTHQPHGAQNKPTEGKNRVLNVLMRRLNMSKTFGENMIFMLNRATRTPEDLCMQLLVLKILYLLFTTKGSEEYFYTNDLCVLVDVFLRELSDLDDESESLRHTYLRVLHPLLTKTQLRSTPYKRAQITMMLESLIDNPAIRDINPTTKRLVERCLTGDWCVQLRSHKKPKASMEDERFASSSPSNDSVANAEPGHFDEGAGKQRVLKPRSSFGNLHDVHASATSQQSKPHTRVVEAVRRPSNESASSLPGVAVATANTGGGHIRRRSGKAHTVDPASSAHPFHLQTASAPTTHAPSTHAPTPTRASSSDTLHLPSSASAGVLPSAPTLPGSFVLSPPSPDFIPPSSSLPGSPIPTAGKASSGSGAAGSGKTQRRMAPPPPPKRRKPPAVPVRASVGRTTSGATITTIASSSSG